MVRTAEYGDERQRIQARSMVIPDGCWLWLLSVTPLGYPVYRRLGTFQAHRAAYIAFIGPIPKV